MHRNLPAITDAQALGGHSSVVCQSDVNDPSLVGGHGLQDDGTPGGGHPVRHSQGQIAQRTSPVLLVLLNVQNDPALMLRCLLAPDEVDHELQSPQRLPPAADEQPRIVPGDLDENRSRVVLGHLPDGGAGADAHARQKPVHHPNGLAGQTATVGQPSDPHLGLLSAQAKKAGLPAANDLDFDLLAVGVELL